MGVETTTTTTITCDNPNCPGNSLDPASFEGWIQLAATTHTAGPEGMPSMPTMVATRIYCCPACAASVSDELNPPKEEA